MRRTSPAHQPTSRPTSRSAGQTWRPAAGRRRRRPVVLAAAALAACTLAQLAALPAASAAGQLAASASALPAASAAGPPAARQPATGQPAAGQPATRHPAAQRPAGAPVRGSQAALYSWGNDTRGELGNGTVRQNTSEPGLVHLPATVTALAAAAGASFAFAAGTGNSVYAWGDNLHGELGNGTQGAAPSPEPVKVRWPAAVTPVTVTAGDSSAYVIGSNGALYDWGNNKSGQLGIGSTRSSTVPVKVPLPAGFTPVAIAAGESAAYAVGSDGSVYAWGSNARGQLGNKSVRSSTTPVRWR